MEEIIEELLSSYGLSPDKKTINVMIRLMELGFDYKWLRNVKIIKDFDELYKTDMPVMDIYGDLSIKHKDLSVNHIRKIISERQLFEI
jgi:hypothetical protein